MTTTSLQGPTWFKLLFMGGLLVFCGAMLGFAPLWTPGWTNDPRIAYGLGFVIGGFGLACLLVGAVLHSNADHPENPSRRSDD